MEARRSVRGKATHMPFNSPGMTQGEIRSTWRGYPDLAKAVLEAREQGWRIVRERKHYRAFCPCEDGANFTIPGTPRSDGNAARRVRANASSCPSQHELLRARSSRPARDQ